MRKLPKHERGTMRSSMTTQESNLSSRTVNISKLKAFVEENFPPGSPLQIIFVDEEDLLSAEAFLAKLPIWLKLNKLSTRD
jgi:hypothetical protein